jgi:hypothetical protein
MAVARRAPSWAELHVPTSWSRAERGRGSTRATSRRRRCSTRRCSRTCRRSFRRGGDGASAAAVRARTGAPVATPGGARSEPTREALARDEGGPQRRAEVEGDEGARGELGGGRSVSPSGADAGAASRRTRRAARGGEAVAPMGRIAETNVRLDALACPNGGRLRCIALGTEPSAASAREPGALDQATRACEGRERQRGSRSTRCPPTTPSASDASGDGANCERELRLAQGEPVPRAAASPGVATRSALAPPEHCGEHSSRARWCDAKCASIA